MLTLCKVPASRVWSPVRTEWIKSHTVMSPGLHHLLLMEATSPTPRFLSADRCIPVSRWWQQCGPGYLPAAGSLWNTSNNTHGRPFVSSACHSSSISHRSWYKEEDTAGISSISLCCLDPARLHGRSVPPPILCVSWWCLWGSPMCRYSRLAGQFQRDQLVPGVKNKACVCVAVQRHSATRSNTAWISDF